LVIDKIFLCQCYMKVTRLKAVFYTIRAALYKNLIMLSIKSVPFMFDFYTVGRVAEKGLLVSFGIFVVYLVPSEMLGYMLIYK
jgi:hypothetical protein